MYHYVNMHAYTYEPKCAFSHSDNWQCSTGRHGEIHRERCQRGADQATDEDEAHGGDRSLYVSAVATATATATTITPTISSHFSDLVHTSTYTYVVDIDIHIYT